jgi:Zn finger protein HypA/HybF involved in hydrogenase expression
MLRQNPSSQPRALQVPECGQRVCQRRLALQEAREGTGGEVNGRNAVKPFCKIECTLCNWEDIAPTEQDAAKQVVPPQCPKCGSKLKLIFDGKSPAVQRIINRNLKGNQ